MLDQISIASIALAISLATTTVGALPLRKDQPPPDLRYLNQTRK
jgi:hypothetical protein